ncbi:PQQ-binding-like beta-propeller repeat protein [bacterium]|nr:PQQ-binding-like beta-propeller repeat protein [bacterium]
MRFLTTVWLLVAASQEPLIAGEAHWPQFRGLHGQGRAPDSTLPIPFGPDKSILWKREMQPGHSSPCIWGNTLFLTTFESDQLTTLALNRLDGSVLWKKSIPPTKIERGHRNGTPANSTPTTDGKSVFVYFGSYGLVAYDFDGNEQWQLPLPVPVTQHGASSSPLLANGRIFLQVDQDVDSHILCVDSESGKMLWKSPRPGFRRGFSTPISWPSHDPKLVIASGTLRVSAYNISDGLLAWEVGGLPNETVASPAFDDEHLYISGWTMGAGVSRIPNYGELLEHDENDDGTIARSEATGPARMHFPYIDADKDGNIDRTEWETMSDIFKKSENALLALKPSPSLKTPPILSWKQTRGLPYVPSPLAYESHVYLVKNGGMISCMNAQTGDVIYREERLGALGDYYASPIAAGKHIITASQSGVVTVIEAGAPDLKVVYQVDFDDIIMATPAVVHNRMYLRTSKTLYCFEQ